MHRSTGFQLQEMYVNEHYSGNVPVADGESGDRQRMARMIAGLYDEDAFNQALGDHHCWFCCLLRLPFLRLPKRTDAFQDARYDLMLPRRHRQQERSSRGCPRVWFHLTGKGELLGEDGASRGG